MRFATLLLAAVAANCATATSMNSQPIPEAFAPIAAEVSGEKSPYKICKDECMKEHEIEGGKVELSNWFYCKFEAC
jgi:hypothetical protein